ncbi:YutD-like domain-containing protein, partial [Staphylococcus epidermidis]
MKLHQQYFQFIQQYTQSFHHQIFSPTYSHILHKYHYLLPHYPYHQLP